MYKKKTVEYVQNNIEYVKNNNNYNSKAVIRIGNIHALQFMCLEILEYKKY